MLRAEAIEINLGRAQIGVIFLAEKRSRLSIVRRRGKLYQRNGLVAEILRQGRRGDADSQASAWLRGG